MGLSGRNAVVTGGASGIGRAICLRLARDGADVAVLDLDQGAGRQVADEVAALHRRAIVVEADVASAASVAAAVERLHAALGPVHILVNDAGIAELVPLREMTEDEWDRMIAVQRIGTPEDIAAACAYLVSEEASFTTGQVLSPNGGGYL